MTLPAIKIEGLSHRFGKRLAVDVVSLAVPDGAFAVLTGPNGAGKSTLVALMANLYGVREGRVSLLGHDISREAPAALAATGLVFQRPALDLDLTLLESLAYHAALHGMDRKEAGVRAEAELDRQSLHALRHEKARALSVGQRRRAEIARCLLHRPQLLLLDEPTAALDPQGRALLLAHLAELRRTRPLTVFWTTHLLEEAKGADLVLSMDKGRLA